MKGLVRILHLEDNPVDAELVRSRLESDGLKCETIRVDTKGAFEAALKNDEFDLIISDFALPSFDGLTALRLVRERNRDIPFIFVSGTLGEESAVATLHNGATDYILKERLSRLAAAVRRALREAEQRTLQRQTHQAMLQAQERFRGIYESSKDAIAYATLDGRLLDVNESFVKLTGYSREDLLAKGYLNPMPSHAQEPEIVERILRTGEPAEYEKGYVRKDGSRVSVAMTVFPVKGSDRRPVALAAIIKDITERKRLEEQFLQAQKMEAVGQLAGGVAHDFNNLLTVINGYSDLLLLRLDKSDPAWTEIEQVREAGKRAAALTAQLLAFTRKEIVEPKIIHINEVLTRAERLLRRLIGEDINLIINLGTDLSPIKVDPNQLEQIIMNLAVNARDAMPEGGRLCIETRQVPAHENPLTGPASVLLEVSDSGCGMDTATQARIFEPFFTTKEAGKGTGLGLATVYHIMKQSHGHITVSSQPGRGTTFGLYFPCAEADLRLSEAELPTETTHGNETILLVEDDPAVRAFVREALRARGYSVLEARHGIEALMISRQFANRIDLLLTDVVMPQMTGAELAKRLQAERSELKVLYASGYPGDASLRSRIIAHETAFLQKPFTVNELAKKIREVLGV